MIDLFLCPECGHDIDHHKKGKDGCMADVDGATCECRLRVSMVVRLLIDRALIAERKAFTDRPDDAFPCTEACVEAPEETCMKHGRTKADLWEQFGFVVRELNVAQRALIAEPTEAEVERAAEALWRESWYPDESEWWGPRWGGKDMDTEVVSMVKRQALAALRAAAEARR